MAKEQHQAIPANTLILEHMGLPVLGDFPFSRRVGTLPSWKSPVDSTGETPSTTVAALVKVSEDDKTVRATIVDVSLQPHVLQWPPRCGSCDAMLPGFHEGQKCTVCEAPNRSVVPRHD